MLLRPFKWCATVLPVLAVLSLSACSSNPPGSTDPPKQTSYERPAKKGNILVRGIKSFFNPSYTSGWKWWQKLLFWAGPGH